MARAKRHNRKRSKPDRRSSGKSSASRLSLETLRQDFTDPKRLQHSMDHLTALLQSEPDLAALRFPAEKLLAALDDLAETASDELEKLTDPLQQRITILNRTISPFLTRSFTVNVETVLMRHLEQARSAPRDFRAVSAGLYFLEIHNRKGAEPGANPLWNLIFDLSYEAASGTAGGTVQTPSPDTPADLDLNDFQAIPDLFEPAENDLADDSAATIHDALKLVETGAVELGFGLDTVLLGLREWLTRQNETGSDRLQALRQTFPREISIRQWHDMIWGLEYAADHLAGEKKRAFETVLKAVRLIPPRDNPVVFGLYYRSVSDYRRFVSDAEAPFADAIAAKPDGIGPIIEFGRYLLTADAPHRALNAFMAASIIDPSDELSRLGAGIACWITESAREARLHWDRAARLWSGYLPAHHPNLQITRELAELEDLAAIPQKAYNLLFFEAISEEESHHG